MPGPLRWLLLAVVLTVFPVTAGVLVFDGDLVVSGYGTYLDPKGNPAGLIGTE